MGKKASERRPRAIVHLDLDAFFAAVEVLENPALAGKPVLVGGLKRGVVSAASYEARAFGVRSAMPMYKALKLCPTAVVLPPRHRLYWEASRRVMAILHQTSPLVEQMSIDEAYLDLTSRVAGWDEAVDAARRLQRRVAEETSLSSSLGVATNKLVAKVASEQNKPGGLTAVRPGTEADFLAPLPVRVLWGVGPVTERKLATIGVTNVGELAHLPAAELQARLGRHGAELARMAQGIDTRPVVPEHERKSVSHETTFGTDLTEAQALQRELWRLSQLVAQRLGEEGICAGTVAVKLRYADFTTLTRQMSLAVPTDEERTIYRAALVLLRRTWARGQPVRLLGVAARQLSVPAGQLPLF